MLTLKDTIFPNMKQVHMVVEGVQNQADATSQLLTIFLTMQTDRLSATWNQQSGTLTVRGFVHSSGNS